MELPENFTIYLLTPPQEAVKAERYGLTSAHMSYRVGGGLHLFRTQTPMPVRGGIMVLDHLGWSGQGSPEAFCQEVARECAARGFKGVLCDFEGQPMVGLKRALELLAPMFQKRRWSLYIPESYAFSAPAVKIVIPTALSGGSLQQRLSQAAERYGADHVALGLEWVAEDFDLPAMQGVGKALSWEELDELLTQRSPAVYFDRGLCAHYFTYMRTGQSAHFVLYDDASSIAEKVGMAAALGITEGFLPDPGRERYLKELFSPAP